jgi:hypothetical protein
LAQLIRDISLCPCEVDQLRFVADRQMENNEPKFGLH